MRRVRGRMPKRCRTPRWRAAAAAEDLELLATSAYMLGREDEYCLLERSHRAYLEPPAAGARRAPSGSVSPSRAGARWAARVAGWARPATARAEGEDCVERGYLLLPVVFEQEASGDFEAAAATAGEAAAIGERFGDADLFALAAHEQGHVLIRHGRIKEGLRLLDETMVAVTAGELSPIVVGDRLLRGDPGLPGRLRGAPRAGVDGCARRAGASASRTSSRSPAAA